MNVEREARRDAKEYARAQMFYGEGAGNRRKLISATVDSKAHRDPTYAIAFHKELARQDMAEHASKARHERVLKDTSKAVNKNIRGILNGNHQGVNTGVLVVLVAAVIARKTGFDQKVKNRYKKWQHSRDNKKLQKSDDFVTLKKYNESDTDNIRKLF